MRLGAGVGVALLLCAPLSALAEETTGEKVVVQSVKVASAGETSGGGAETDATTQNGDVSKPVTQARATPQPQPVRSSPTLVARINLNSQRMQVTSNGKVIGDWAISSGKFNYETPAGSFRPKWSSRMHYSRKYNNSPMPYSVFFNGGIATHGTTYTGRLGSPASHGCIRLQTANARRFYKLVHAHGYKRTRIIVTGKADVRRVASTSRPTPSSRRNSFSQAARQSRKNPYWASGPRRLSVREYDRARMARHRDRVQSYYRSRRMVYPGDRW